jgi:hypothetical protein
VLTMLSFRRIFVATLTFAAVATPVQALAEELSTQDIKYLAELDLMLLRNEKYNFTPFVKKLPNEAKIKDGKGVCERIKNGVSWNEHLTFLFSEGFSDDSPRNQDIQREYMLTAWFVGVHNYCPEYKGELRTQK